MQIGQPELVLATEISKLIKIGVEVTFSKQNQAVCKESKMEVCKWTSSVGILVFYWYVIVI